MTLAEATQHRTRFLRTYAGLRQWQQNIDQAARLSQRCRPAPDWSGCWTRAA
ncbi:MAG: hypothetical protein IPH55_01375 [Betaproteobacteria bacterium]|nr:hypothetical protein [Betaproteobacteria bacterium]